MQKMINHKTIKTEDGMISISQHTESKREILISYSTGSSSQTMHLTTNEAKQIIKTLKTWVK